MKILIATDGTAHGTAAVKGVGQFKLTHADQVRIISVVDMPVPLAIDVYGGYLPDTTELEKAARKNGERVLEEAIDFAKKLTGENGPEVTGELLFGSPESRIVESAENMRADLVIVGSHGYNRWERLLLGSVSNSVVQHAPCSVLVIRSSEVKA